MTDQEKRIAQSCTVNGLYFCNGDYEETRREVIEEHNYNENIDEYDIEFDTMTRMLSEHLDYGPLSETYDETEDGDKHSSLMALRADICADIASAWIDGEYETMDIPVEQWLDQAQKDCHDAVLKHYLGEMGEAVIEQLWKPDGDKIQDEQLAEFIGRYKIIEIHRQSTATTFDEFWTEVNTSFSGYPLDGSPFGTEEAEKYAKFTWERYGDD